MTLRMLGDTLDFEADSAAAIGDLLDAECDAWHKRQCVDKDWFKFICSKNLRGMLSRMRRTRSKSPPLTPAYLTFRTTAGC